MQPLVSFVLEDHFQSEPEEQGNYAFLMGLGATGVIIARLAGQDRCVFDYFTVEPTVQYRGRVVHGNFNERDDIMWDFSVSFEHINLHYTELTLELGSKTLYLNLGYDPYQLEILIFSEVNGKLDMQVKPLVNGVEFQSETGLWLDYNDGGYPNGGGSTPFRAPMLFSHNNEICVSFLGTDTIQQSGEWKIVTRQHVWRYNHTLHSIGRDAWEVTAPISTPDTGERRDGALVWDGPTSDGRRLFGRYDPPVGSWSNTGGLGVGSWAPGRFPDVRLVDLPPWDRTWQYGWPWQMAAMPGGMVALTPDPDEATAGDVPLRWSRLKWYVIRPDLEVVSGIVTIAPERRGRPWIARPRHNRNSFYLLSLHYGPPWDAHWVDQFHFDGTSVSHGEQFRYNYDTYGFEADFEVAFALTSDCVLTHLSYGYDPRFGSGSANRVTRVTMYNVCDINADSLRRPPVWDEI